MMPNRFRQAPASGNCCKAAGLLHFPVDVGHEVGRPFAGARSSRRNAKRAPCKEAGKHGRRLLPMLVATRLCERFSAKRRGWSSVDRGTPQETLERN